MNSPITNLLCSCGGPHMHTVENCARCCWCFVVEEGKPPHEGHPECMLAAKRLGPIQTRFRTAILAEREACAKIVEETRNPTASMPKHLAAAMRRSPDYVMRAVVDTLVVNLATLIRARIG